MFEPYTFDELRALGCPDGLLIQYIGFTKEEINNLIKKSEQTDE